MSTPKVKDPEATRTYTMDWSDYLADLGNGVTIVDSEWDVPDGLTVLSSSNTDTTTKIKVSGGTVNCDYTLYNKITASNADADVDRRALLIQIRDASTFTEPTDNEIALDAVRAMLAQKATRDQKEYTIANRQLKRYDMTELLALETRLTQLVNSERRRTAARKGLPVIQNIYTRFSNPR